MGSLSAEVYRVLQPYTAFPWPLMTSQCRRHGIDPAAITPTLLGCVLQDLALGVARFNTTAAGLGVRRALVELLRQATSDGAPRKDYGVAV